MAMLMLVHYVCRCSWCDLKHLLRLHRACLTSTAMATWTGTTLPLLPTKCDLRLSSFCELVRFSSISDILGEFLCMFRQLLKLLQHSMPGGGGFATGLLLGLRS